MNFRTGEHVTQIRIIAVRDPSFIFNFKAESECDKFPHDFRGDYEVWLNHSSVVE
jgi:hypothetical protein